MQILATRIRKQFQNPDLKIYFERSDENLIFSPVTCLDVCCSLSRIVFYLRQLSKLFRFSLHNSRKDSIRFGAASGEIAVTQLPFNLR